MSPQRLPRVVSLVPSLTELLLALGLRELIVGRTGFCIHPADQVRDIPKLGGTKDVRLDRLRALAPTHVVVNVDENRRELADWIDAWPPAQRPQLVVTHPGGPDEVPPLIDSLLARLAPGLPPALRADATARAAALQASLRDELAATVSSGRPMRRVLYLIWREPWMSVARDTYIARMLARVNWRTLPAVDGGAAGAARYPVLRGDEPWLAEVDLVLLSSEPYSFKPEHLPLAGALCPKADLRLVDGEALSWYGPRTVDGLRLLRRLAAELRGGGAAAA